MSELKAGRELDALVAEKVMGWTHVTNGYGVPPLHPNSKPTARAAGTIPNYSTDFAASMEVVKRIQREGHPWTFTGLFHEHADIDKLPEAICLAALKSVGA